MSHNGSLQLIIMETVPHTLDTIFQGNESLSIIEIFEEALEKSLENLNISDTGKQTVGLNSGITD